MNREHSYYDVNKDNNMIELITILYELHKWMILRIINVNYNLVNLNLIRHGVSEG